MAGNYTHIGANSTVNVSSHPCTLHNVCINTLGATNNIVTLYDNALGNTSGNIIAVVNTTATIGVLNFECQCLLGISAVMSGGTAGDVTIVFG